MRADEFLIEANGIRAGTPGESYTDPSGVEYQFQSWNWNFPAKKDQYASLDIMNQDILAVSGNDETKILWINQPSNRSKSFGYAAFTSSTSPKKEIWVGKYFDRKSSNNTIFDKDIKTVSGLTAGSANKASSAAIKASAQLKPLDVGIADSRQRTIKTIISAVSSHGLGLQLGDSLIAASQRASIIFPKLAKLSPALQDDFGEVLSPVAMISGHPQVTGQLDQAVIDVFKGQNLKGATISYPVSLTNGLVDSYIHKGGMELAVSSKGKKGANGSINNIFKAKTQAADTDNGQVYIKKFAKASGILDICNEHQRYAPLVLGVKFKVISQAESDAIYNLLEVEDARSVKRQLTGNPKDPKQIVKPATPADLAKVPVILRRIFNMGGYKAGSFVGFICIARVARLVADHVNSDTKIQFGEAIRSFLNSSAMVQVKCQVSPAGSDAVVKSINVIYPPNFTGTAKMESNWYSGRQIKGGFSFSLPSS